MSQIDADLEGVTVALFLAPGGTAEVEKTFSEVSAGDYDALVIPGGTVGADTLRTDEDAVELLREHVVDGMPVGEICHGPWLLVEADVIAGRRLTSYSSLRTDIENAGGDWHDDEVIVDGEIITSRDPDDLPRSVRP